MTQINKKQAQQMASSQAPETVYHFTNGMPGFPALKTFYIRNLKDGSYPPLKIMVSVDAPSISFILYPHTKGDSLFDSQTLLSLAQTYQCSHNIIEIYSIVTVHLPEGEIQLTTNLKAPIVLDQTAYQGWQHIIPSRDAELCAPLTKLSSTFQTMRQLSPSKTA